jgi:hypothetical protein
MKAIRLIIPLLLMSVTGWGQLKPLVNTGTNGSVQIGGLGSFVGAGSSGEQIDVQNILQKLTFTYDATQRYILDVSGNDNNAQLVESNCFKGANSLIFPQLSSDPVSDNLTFYNFSIEFTFSVATNSGFQIIAGRNNGATTAKWLSLFVVYSDKLVYYSANGTSASTVDIISPVSLNTIYVCKVTVNNAAGRIDWSVNGTSGGANFTNYTPNTNQTGDYVAIGRGTAGYYFALNGKLCGVKYYTSTNYTSLSHYWPMSEGNGTVCYDVVGTKDMTLAASTWSTQDYHHYNIIHGFQLYGNSSTTNTLTRVPYNFDNTTKSPTISGYTKFSDCPAGAFHNFAETGIKRNYNSVQALTDAGVSSTNVIYYGALSGWSGRSFCKNHLENESEYTLFQTTKDRRSLYAYKPYSYFMNDSVAKVIIAGKSGKIHNTNIKYAANVTSTSSVFYECFIRPGTWNLSNATTELPIQISNFCGLIGYSSDSVIINGHLAAETAKATIQNTPLINSNGGFRLAGLTGTAQNMRYVLHDDPGVNDAVKRIDDVNLEHLGNHEAYLIDNTVWNTTDAAGCGFNSKTRVVVNNSTFIGKVLDGGVGRGYATHYTSPLANAAILKFTNCTFSSNGNYSFRWNTGPSAQYDRVEFRACDFGGKDIYYDPSATYDTMANKVQLYKLATDDGTDVTPATNYNYIGLRIAASAGNTLTINRTATSVLLLSSEITTNAYTVTGQKNITDNVLITGYVGLKGLLGNCSSVNKILSVKLNGVDTNIVFNQNYSAMTNAQVLTSINTINPNVQFSEYNYITNAKLENL